MMGFPLKGWPFMEGHAVSLKVFGLLWSRAPQKSLFARRRFGNRQNTVSRVRFQKRDVTEICGKLGELRQSQGEATLRRHNLPTSLKTTGKTHYNHIKKINNKVLSTKLFSTVVSTTPSTRWTTTSQRENGTSREENGNPTSMGKTW